MLYALGVIVFAVGLLLSIALHEVGHMVPAKRFGVKVTQYMVGFGPTLWSRRKGDTEYGVKAIPLGGYIRMIGMVPPRQDGTVSRWPRRMASAIEDFRRVSRAEVGRGDEDRQFYRLTPGKKMIVMLGGPTMNLVIYLLLTVALLSMLGSPRNDTTTTIQSVSKCVVPATAAATQTNCATANAPAYVAGLKPNDQVLAINGTSINSWDQAVSIVEASPGVPLTFVVERNGAPVTLQITPVKNVKYVNDTGSQTKVAGYIGVSDLTRRYYQPVPLPQIPGQIVSQVALGLHAIGSYPTKIVSLWHTVFNGTPRDPNGAIGVVGIGRLGGDFAQSKLLDVQDKIFALVGLLAGINLLLFFFNLLPLLPLDGGHVAGAMVESVKRGRARLRARVPAGANGVVDRPGDDGAGRRPREPIFVDTAQMLPVMYAVASVLVVLTLLTLWADIVDPISLGGG